MKTKPNILNDMIEQTLRLINKYNSLEKKLYNFGIDELLTPAEIHTIDCIGKNSGINVTLLAEKLGITKGAVSQMINKLKKKNLVVKLKDSENDKEVILLLSKKGKTAFNGHVKFHEDIYKDLIPLLENTSMEGINSFKEIINKIEFYLDRYKK
ncbi:MAG TPA: MarR family winged helix-turn-helix transcriptional regulator [Smithella sp.]|nr:MarR family winged helix-turn-helix transcriptional regulator [Smithella sp.]